MLSSRIARELNLAYSPVAILFSDTKPEAARHFVEGRWGCVVGMLTAAAKGQTAVFDRSTCGCTGGQVGLGFGRDTYSTFPGGIEYFLSTGRGEGFREGEGYRKTPELARSFIDDLPDVQAPLTYVVFKPIDQVDLDQETPHEVVFYANPDQLTALVVLANYDRPSGDNVIIPSASGCQSVGIIPYAEAQREPPRAVVGMIDVSARPMVPADTVTFTVPFRMFQQMEENVTGSFLEKGAWAKVKARIPAPASSAAG